MYLNSIKDLKRDYNQALARYYNKSFIIKMIAGKFLGGELGNCDLAFRVALRRGFGDANIEKKLNKSAEKAVALLQSRAWACGELIGELEELINKSQKASVPFDALVKDIRAIQMKLEKIINSSIGQSSKIAKQYDLKIRKERFIAGNYLPKFKKTANSPIYNSSATKAGFEGLDEFDQEFK